MAAAIDIDFRISVKVQAARRLPSLIETCKLNAADPFAYLTSTVNAIVSGHKQSRIEELLPWNYPVE
ncbi:transposase domain-containing protein [Rhizobium johnstonii]